MRTISLLLFVGLAFTLSAVAQPSVPKEVQKAFQAKFSKASDVKWDKENDSEFEAEFMMNDVEMSANFSAKGVWIETETEIAIAKLPAAITQRLAKDFKGYAVKEAASVEKPGKDMTYEVEVRKGEKTIEVLLSKDGKVLEKKEVKAEENDRDEDND
ncbi:MAG: PepSY-like domain-containing protein [Bacteroidetes bacterium]|nr:PepSY-like domain-containing protein [Bacteroidota bacterium]